MKNVHLITKEQEGADVLHQYLYITSDEEIKVGDFGYNIVSKTIDKFTISLLSNKQYYKKIILTDNPDLIADGVQAIDNEFLELFVKNPSCEEVKVEKENICARCYSNDVDECWSAKECSDGRYDKIKYKIIIPQEEPKQDLEKEMFDLEQELDIPSSFRWHNSKPKQETLEEVRKVERSDLYNKIHSIVKQIPREDVETDAMDASSCAYDIEQLFYKWQKEKSYSEEDMISFAKFFKQYTFIDNTSVGDLYALDETGNHPAYKIAELISIFKKKQNEK